MFGVLMAPVVGRLVDSLVPWLATVIATVALILFQAVQTGAGGVHIAAVIIVCFGIDVFRQMQQVSLTSAVFSIDPKARSRLNAIILISVRSFCSRVPSGAESCSLGVHGADHGHVRGYQGLREVRLASRCRAFGCLDGFHLSCDARSGAALLTLHVVWVRGRFEREKNPAAADSWDLGNCVRDAYSRVFSG